MKKKNILAYVGHNHDKNRVKNDFYPTPFNATYELLEKEKLLDPIYECACGDGAISKVLIEKGYEVYSSDLIDRGYGEVGVDFLKSTDKRFNTIITNPPFNLSTEFTLKALELSQRYVIFLNKLSFLEGIKRRQTLFNRGHLKTVYVFTKRLKFGGSGLMAFAWYIFDKQYSGTAELKWI
tara:strand:+ start:23 stop:562 length:540 start_codon:yes stop_codon:yes gene_type:complete